jgi:hypothetical protein
MKKLLLILLCLPLIGFGQSVKHPTKELMINTLYKLHDELRNKNYENAIEYVFFNDSLFLVNNGLEFIPDTEKKRRISQMPRLIELNEISERGIQILSSNAVFGKVTDVYEDTERRLSQIKVRGLIANKCFGLNIDNTSLEVMAIWRNNKFLFYKLDNIGKLEFDMSKN